MARVEWAEEAVLNLDRLIVTHSLPANTRERVKHSLQPLELFPLLGATIARRAGHEIRFVLGPWPWMIVTYTTFEADDLVVVLSVEDGRSAVSSTATRTR